MSYDPDEMMLELFRAEVESHSDSLTNSLLKLEQDPEATTVLDGMMRAAHSIKGAARIVRVDPAVEVAHVMEDCFVAAQRGELMLESSAIDVLLRSVDLLGQISEASKNPKVDWSTFDSTIRTSVEQLRCVLNKMPIPAAVSDVAATSIANQPELVAADETSKSTSTDVITAIEVTLPKSAIASCSMEMATPGNRLVMPKFFGRENAETLRVELLAMLQSSDTVSLDFCSMQDLDAVGLAWLHSAAVYARKNSKLLKVANASASVKHVLELVGLRDSKDS